MPAEGDASLYDALPDPLLFVDAQGQVASCNLTAERWLGRGREELVGLPITELFDDECREELGQIAATGWGWVAERRFTLRDGRVVGLNASRTGPEPDARFLVSMHDLTTLSVLDEAADQQKRLEALSDLAGAVARELNDPMSIVQGRLELLLELGVEDPDSVRRHLEVALEHSRRVSATLRNLRLVGRTAEPRDEPVGLERAIAEALELVGPRARSVVTEIRPPDLSTSGEAAMYARVFANLLRRALDHASRTGQIEFKAQAERGQVVVRISARARGRASERPNGGDGGPGSFAIDETLLASAGGRLRVDGSGNEATYTVYLPPAPHRRARAKPIGDHLLVVGSEDLERTVSSLLGREGFAITAARDGEQALELADQTHFDAVVTDLLLDGVSGLGLAEALLRAHPELTGRIVIVSPTKMETVPSSVVPVDPPLRRRPLLEALGRRVR